MNIGIVFNQFSLAANAEMYIFDEGRMVMDSAIKSSHFTYSSSVGIFPVKGNSVIIYIFENNNFGAFQSSIGIQNLEAGFQEMYDVGDNESQLRTLSIDCIQKIMCQTNKLTAARAVARFSSNGYAGTGTLINDENGDGRAFFLTAFHVIDVSGGFLGGSNGVIDQNELNALANARFQFRFWATNCNGTVITNGLSFSGAILRAAWNNSDVVLLELVNGPGIGDGVNYAGWNRQTNAPADYGSTIIHHADAQDMRITNTRSVNNWFWNNMFWTAKYSSGVVTQGSSGAALLNEYDQVVGQLRSGWSSCNFTDFGDRYGKFHHSWNGAGLQTWLSPSQGLSSVNALVLSPLSINGVDVIDCSGSSFTYSVPNLLSCSYSWTVPNSLNIVSGQNTANLVVTRNSSVPFSSGQISVTITDSRGFNRQVVVTKNFSVGLPSILGVSTTINSCLGGSDWELGLDANVGNQNVTSYIWTKNGSLYSSGPSPSFYTYEFPPSCMQIGVSAVNACGTGPEASMMYCPPCGGFRITVSPNPAKDEMVVTINKDRIDKIDKSAKNTTEIMLVETVTGMTIKTWVLGYSNNYRLSLAGVKKGNYVVVVKNGTEKVSKQIRVE